MLQTFIRFFLLLSVLASVAGCKTKNNNYEAEISSLTGQMSLEEKVILLHGNSMFTNGDCKRLGIPALKLSDGPHGVREEISTNSFKPAGWTTDSASYFPTGTAVAATWNKELAYRQGNALGAEARARNKDIILGPGVNIQRTPLGGRNFEYMSEDPFLTSAIAVPYIQGIQKNDVAACVKHYIANNQELDRGTVDIGMSERALREIYLPAFKAAVEKGNVMSIMGAYNKFRGDWCCENSYLFNTILRDEWGFKGIAMSDWGAVHSTVKAANAGLDLEMGTRGPFNEFYFADPLIKAVEDGEVSTETINEKVKHILWVAYKLKVMGDTTSRSKGEFVSPAHSKTAYDVAKESVVLLKNENNTLPLQIGDIKSIAVIGDNATQKHAQGGYSSGVKANYEVTPLEGLKSSVGNMATIEYTRGYSNPPRNHFRGKLPQSDPVANQDSLINEAVKIASRSDVAIIFGGLNHDFDTEGRDKDNLDLPYSQVKLINAVAKVNPRTILVLIAGSPVNFRGFINNVPAILWGWFNGMEGGNALADIILGKVNPSGKMPFTLPDSLEQTPPHALKNYHGDEEPLNYEEDILVGYRWFDAHNLQPVFPFGHGLSYTTFNYSDLNVSSSDDNITISFSLQNTGDRDGAETAQVYVSAPGTEVLRAPRELKGFQKVDLKKDEIKNIVVKINKSDLAWYNEESHSWQIEKGDYKIFVGSSERDIRLKKEIEIE